jgi:hypothetical protein
MPSLWSGGPLEAKPVHVWENPAIQKYAADEDNEGMYENIRDLYARFKAD